MFEDELAIAVLEAIEVRQQRNGLKVERLRMNEKPQNLGKFKK